MTAREWIDQLNLQPHPEGGYYKRTYCSERIFSGNIELDPFPAGRPHSTAIFYLMEASDFAGFHRIKSDELWHFHDGSQLELYILRSPDRLELIRMGKGDALQAVVPANHWFAAVPARHSDYSLVSCTVSPGFDFRDHEMASTPELIEQFPSHAELIRRLCRF
jgi:hypothetical protein